MSADTLQKMRGQLIAIEGIDQSGKRTQALLLAKELSRNGFKATVWSFPDYSTPLGRQLRAYLAGRSTLEYHALHLLYAANKWERAEELRNEIRRGRNVIVNRYSPSNLAYGVAHGLPVNWLEWLEDGLPKADLVFILDVRADTSFKRKRERRDVHESDRDYLTKVRRAYLRLARTNGWQVVKADREPAIIHSELWARASRILRGRR